MNAWPQWYRDTLKETEVRDYHLYFEFFSPEFFVLLILDVGLLVWQKDVVAIRKEKDFQKKLDFAIACKAKGNNYFKSNQFSLALHEYGRILSIFDWLEYAVKDTKKVKVE